MANTLPTDNSVINDLAITQTSDPRVLIAKVTPRDWRTLVRDDVSGWDITGPSYPTKSEALANVATVAAYAY